MRTLPDLVKDATDRNRTSPFAFTGNKFEFRMVGSRDSIASCNIVLNTITAEVFQEVNDRLEKAADRDLEIHDIIKEFAPSTSGLSSTATGIPGSGRKRQNAGDFRTFRPWWTRFRR